MSPVSSLDLSPFRRRIRLVRVWRCAAVGGCLGAGVSVVLAALDYFGVIDATPRLLTVPLILGIAAGVGYALVERLPENVIARSVDRRGGLADRLVSASEVPASTNALAGSLLADAQDKAETLRPAVLYPIRLNRWHGVLLGLAALCVLVFVMGNTGIFKGPKAKADAAELKKDADQVERVIKPELEAAKRADASPQDKELARQLNKFTSDLRKGRLSKQQALVQANKLAEQAQKLQASRTAALAQSVQGAQTASQKLEAMQNQAGLQKSDAAKLADQARALSSKIAAMQQSLSAAQSGKSKLSAAEKAALAAKLAAAQKLLQQIQLSQQAQEFLQKLQNMPDYQAAQKLLAQLAAQAQAQQAGQQAPLTSEQMKEMADQLEKMAKEFSSDAKMKELAQQMLEAAKNARLGQGSQLGPGLMGAFGLGQGPSMGGLSLGMSHGAGAPSPDKWVGDHGTLSKSDKSSLLNVKFQDRQITSQIGSKGAETYTEVLGPSAPSGKSGVPYQAVLPKYEKSAESALDKGDVPPQMRTKVRDYFDSLRK
jgi:hypothetical protein